jgi:hypothetical protein
MRNHSLLIIVGLLGVAAAHAQTAGTVNLSVSPTQASNTATPVLTWSTSPVAQSCTASGGWNGTKFASGSQTLSAITATTSYTLTCTWASGSAAVRWTIPTTNTNGTPLTNLASYKILYGTSASALNQTQAVTNPAATSATVVGLTPATWYFAMRAVNATGTESANSNVGTKTIAGASAARTVTTTITTTAPRTLRTDQTSVYDVVTSNGVRVRGRVVGTIAVGQSCDQSYTVGSGYYRVSRSLVTFTRTSRSQRVVAHCVLQ